MLHFKIPYSAQVNFWLIFLCVCKTLRAFLILAKLLASTLGSLKMPVNLTRKTREIRAHNRTPFLITFSRSKIASTWFMSIYRALNWPIYFNHCTSEASKRIISSALYGKTRSFSSETQTEFDLRELLFMIKAGASRGSTLDELVLTT